MISLTACKSAFWLTTTWVNPAHSQKKPEFATMEKTTTYFIFKNKKAIDFGHIDRMSSHFYLDNLIQLIVCKPC